MTRKDYVLIAKAIAKAYTISDNHVDAVDTIAFVTECIADALADDNPRFDRARFIKATLADD